MAISFNPLNTTNFSGSFVSSSQGGVQGTTTDDPVNRFKLSGGVVDSSETYPMWGGIAVTADIAANPLLAAGMLGQTLSRATTYSTIGTGINGFTVFDQNYSAISTASSPVPMVNQGDTINYVRMGSGVRLWLAIDSALATLYGSAIDSQVSWDFTNQQIIAFDTTALDVKILDIQVGNSKTVSYNTSTGLATWSETGSVALVEI